ncbi:hypothetical protein HDU93_008449 [Gonapodya sp. JEL0774]|nr:hypothetical protein HDU93_008449 [Gonapodya sp. JEL0774]
MHATAVTAEVHYENGLSPETLPLAINLLDRYLSKRTIPKRDFQLLGITALFVASKYCDLPSFTLTIHAVITLCCNLYRRGDIAEMERRILDVVSFDLSHRGAPWVLAVVTGEQSRSDDGTRWPYGSLSAGSTSGFLHSVPIVALPQLHLSVAYFLADMTLLYRRFIGLRGAAVAVGCMIAAARIVDGWGLQCGVARSAVELNPTTINQLSHLAAGDDVVPAIADNLVECATTLIRSQSRNGNRSYPSQETQAQLPGILRKWGGVRIDSQFEIGYGQSASLTVTLYEILLGFDEFLNAEEEKRRIVMGHYLTPVGTSPPRALQGNGSSRGNDYFTFTPPSPSTQSPYDNIQPQARFDTSSTSGNGNGVSLAHDGTPTSYNFSGSKTGYSHAAVAGPEYATNSRQELQCVGVQPSVVMAIPTRSPPQSKSLECLLPTPPHDTSPHGSKRERQSLSPSEMVLYESAVRTSIGGVGPAAVAVAVAIQPRPVAKREGIAARRVRSGKHAGEHSIGEILNVSEVQTSGHSATRDQRPIATVTERISEISITERGVLSGNPGTDYLTPPLSPGMDLDNAGYFSGPSTRRE